MNLSISTENPLYRLFLAACPMALQEDFGAWVAGMANACRSETGENNISESGLIDWVQDNHCAFQEGEWQQTSESHG